MDWDTVKGVLAKVAPTIGAAVGGPLGGAAGAIIGSVLGVEDASSPDQVATAIAGATPEQLMQLKQADRDFQVKMAELGFANVQALEALAVKDRADARNMQLVSKAVTVPILAYAIVGAFLAMVGASLLGFAKVDSVLAGTLVGYLSAKAEQVIAFYFGGSHGSERKDVLLANSLPPSVTPKP